MSAIQNHDKYVCSGGELDDDSTALSSWNKFRCSASFLILFALGSGIVSCIGAHTLFKCNREQLERQVGFDDVTVIQPLVAAAVPPPV